MTGPESTFGVSPVVFGSASLLEDDATEHHARAVLDAAVDLGAGRLDTAPMYGHGRAEPLVLALGQSRGVPVTTKVGIEPAPRAPRWRRAAAAAVERLPPRMRTAVRRAAGAAESDPFASSHRFDPAVVRASVERSLRSAARLDRLLLHEVQPPDVTDELLELLQRFRADGDVGELGCATRNVITDSVLRRSAGLLTVAHVSTAPLGDPVPPVPEGVRLVGHGALGAGGRDLRRLRAVLERPGTEERAWTAATAGTAFAGGPGLVRALIARAGSRGVDELLVATTRLDRVAGLVGAAAATERLDPVASDALERAVRVASGRTGRGAPC